MIAETAVKARERERERERCSLSEDTMTNGTARTSIAEANRVLYVCIMRKSGKGSAATWTNKVYFECHSWYKSRYCLDKVLMKAFDTNSVKGVN